MNLKGILVGAGYFARFQAEAWRRIPAAEIVAVADAAPGKARALADEFGIASAYGSAEEALDRERPDFVDDQRMVETPLALLPDEDLRPKREVLDAMMTAL